MPRLLTQCLILLVLFAGFISAVDAYIVHEDTAHEAHEYNASMHDSQDYSKSPVHNEVDEHGCCHAAGHLMGFAPTIQYPLLNGMSMLSVSSAPITGSNTSKIPTPPPRSEILKVYGAFARCLREAYFCLFVSG